jgi:hypothetical protein
VKRLLLILGVVVLLLVAGIWIFLDPLIATGIEKGATYATGVETKVDGVDASLLSGSFGIQGLSLANPPGFREEPFVEMKTARATWQNGTILSERLVMDELVLDGVEVNLERADAGTNYGVILDNLEKLSSKEPGDKAEEPAEGGKQLTIKRIEIKNVHAGLHLSGVPLASGSMSVTIPSIVIEDFSSDGSTTEIVAQLTAELIQGILAQVLAFGKDIFPADMLNDLGKGLGDLGGAIGEGAKEAVKGIEGALKGVGDLFDKKK